jgi:hypothetical protein
VNQELGYFLGCFRWGEGDSHTKLPIILIALKVFSTYAEKYPSLYPVVECSGRAILPGSPPIKLVDGPRRSSKMIATAASYVEASQASGLHAIRMRSGDYTSDGLSGGTVYHVGEDAHGFYCGFAGLVIRGSETSDILHFIDPRAIYPFFGIKNGLRNKILAPKRRQTLKRVTVSEGCRDF